MYEHLFFGSGEAMVEWFNRNREGFSRLNRKFPGDARNLLSNQMSPEIQMLAEQANGSITAFHIVIENLIRTSPDCIVKIEPLFRPKNGLWHSAIDYEANRMSLPFALSNSWDESVYRAFADGGCARMAFAGFGVSLKCKNDEAVLRSYDGAGLERERERTGNPDLPFVDLVVGSMRTLIPKEHKEYPALAEFIGAVEKCDEETVGGLPFYRILLWSGPADDPAGFPWLLHIAQARSDGYIPKVGDFVTGLAVVYGTALEARRYRRPTVFQPSADDAEADDDAEAPHPPKTPARKTEASPPVGEASRHGFDWLPRRPASYPDAYETKRCFPLGPFAVLPGYVSYAEYRAKLGDDGRLQDAPGIGDDALAGVFRQIFGSFSKNDQKELALACRFAGLRHVLRNPDTNETHLWICCQQLAGLLREHVNLLVAMDAERKVLRYTWLSSMADVTCGAERREVLLNPDSQKETDGYVTLRQLLCRIRQTTTDGYFILDDGVHAEFIQAKCLSESKTKSYEFYWQIAGRQWDFGTAAPLPESRVLELVSLYWHEGIQALESAEEWVVDNHAPTVTGK